MSKSEKQDENDQGENKIIETVFVSGENEEPTTYRIPALVFQGNDFLAFCEKRLEGSGDCGPIEMVLKIGSLGDDGVSWGQETILYSDINKTRPMNPVPIVVDKDHVILMFNTFKENVSEKKVTKDDWRLLMKHSCDGGKTWKPPQELQVDKIFSGESGIPSCCAIGPGHGVKLESSGRLIVSGHVKLKNSKELFVIVSDDNGQKWKIRSSIPSATFNGNSVVGNECQPVDVGSGKIVINSRTSGKIPRMQSYSDNAGDTFTHSEIIKPLIGPCNQETDGCQGSTIGFKAPSNSGGNTYWALFSNPADTKKREKLSIRLSKDGCCKKWSNPRQVVEDDSGYSDLTLFPQDGKLKAACLFEHNNNIDFIIIDDINDFQFPPDE